MIQTVWVKTAVRNDHSQKKLPKLIPWYRSVYNGIALDIMRKLKNAVYKLTIDKQQPVLVNVLIRSIFEH